MGLFLMPSLGADMEAATLVEWLVQPGARVKRGDCIAVVETQKGAIEIEVYEDGVFEHGLVPLGTRVPVGTPLAMITGPGETPAPTIIPQPSVTTPSVLTPIPAAAPARAAPYPGRLKISPAARRLAEQHDVELGTLQGSGPEGAIVLADVEPRIKAAPVAQPPAPSGMREAIAAAMARSKREIPHYYLGHTVSLAEAEAWLAQHNAGREPAERMLMATLFVKAVARAAKKYVDFNGYYVEGAYRPSDAVHLGLAINIRGTGLVAPAIHDADKLELDALMAAMRDLVARVRAGRFRSSELADPTITVSSLGEPGVESLYGVIYPPQVAIVGFGMPVLRPWATPDGVVARRTVRMTLAGDHRVSDGHRGAAFLGAIARHLANPERL